MNAILVLMALMSLMVGVILAFTPWLMPDSECFAVTVPHGAREQDPLRRYMRSYTCCIAAITALCVLMWPVGLMRQDINIETSQGTRMLSALSLVTVLLPCVVSVFLMLYFRARVLAVKQERDWKPERELSAAAVGPEDTPQPISLAWNLLYIPLVVAMAAFALVNYDRFPDMVPMNMDLNGNVATYVPKSPRTVLFPALVAAFMGAVFTLTHWGIIRSKKPLDPGAPASSALAYGRFARLQSIEMVVGGIALSALIGIMFYASSLGVVSMPVAATVIILVTVAFVAVVLFIAVYTGQAGARFAVFMNQGDMARDDDRYWVLGMFYCNRDDPSIFLPKRFGVGWTMNVANPLSWVLVAGIVALTIAFVWLTGAL